MLGTDQATRDARRKEPARIAAEIRREADGRLCSACRFHAANACTRWEWLPEARPLKLYRDDAVACAQWEADGAAAH